VEEAKDEATDKHEKKLDALMEKIKQIQTFGSVTNSTGKTTTSTTAESTTVSFINSTSK